jgi:hypothetical protein
MHLTINQSDWVGMELVENRDGVVVCIHTWDKLWMITDISINENNLLGHNVRNATIYQ